MVQTRQIKNDTEDTFFNHECKELTKDCEIQRKQLLKVYLYFVVD